MPAPGHSESQVLINSNPLQGVIMGPEQAPGTTDRENAEMLVERFMRGLDLRLGTMEEQFHKYVDSLFNMVSQASAEPAYAPIKLGPKLGKAIAQIQRNIKAAGKGGRNNYDHYTYSTLADYYEVLQPQLKEVDIWIVFDIVRIDTLPNIITSTGKEERHVMVKVACTIGDAEGAETITIYGYGEGSDRGDKAIYKAFTGAKKYLLSNVFQIPSADDPEDSRGQEADQQPPRQQSRQQQRQQPPAQRASAQPQNQPGEINADLKAKKAPPRVILVQGNKAYNPAYSAHCGTINVEKIEVLRMAREEVVKKGFYDKKDHYEWVVKKFYAPAGISPTIVEYLQDIRPAWFSTILDVTQNHPEDIRPIDQQQAAGV